MDVETIRMHGRPRRIPKDTLVSGVGGTAQASDVTPGRAVRMTVSRKCPGQDVDSAAGYGDLSGLSPTAAATTQVPVYPGCLHKRCKYYIDLPLIEIIFLD
jgi:hypothetical protein